VLVVADSSPLIFLGRLGLTHILPSLYGRIVVPTSVRDEVIAEEQELPGAAALRSAEWAEFVQHDAADPLLALLGATLGPGERALISIATARRADLVLIDDRQARLAAERLGLQVKGTVGVLVQANARGHLPKLAPALRLLLAAGARLSPALLEAALRAAGESPDG
jgi:predicted nucleic acid-binding protein